MSSAHPPPVRFAMHSTSPSRSVAEDPSLARQWAQLVNLAPRQVPTSVVETILRSFPSKPRVKLHKLDISLTPEAERAYRSHYYALKKNLKRNQRSRTMEACIAGSISLIYGTRIDDILRDGFLGEKALDFLRKSPGKLPDHPLPLEEIGRANIDIRKERSGMARSPTTTPTRSGLILEAYVLPETPELKAEIERISSKVVGPTVELSEIRRQFDEFTAQKEEFMKDM